MWMGPLVVDHTYCIGLISKLKIHFCFFFDCVVSKPEDNGYVNVTKSLFRICEWWKERVATVCGCGNTSLCMCVWSVSVFYTSRHPSDFSRFRILSLCNTVKWNEIFFSRKMTRAVIVARALLFCVSLMFLVNLLAHDCYGAQTKTAGFREDTHKPPLGQPRGPLSGFFGVLKKPK